jgi:biopolymer transport protein ExbB
MSPFDNFRRRQIIKRVSHVGVGTSTASFAKTGATRGNVIKRNRGICVPDVLSTVVLALAFFLSVPVPARAQGRSAADAPSKEAAVQVRSPQDAAAGNPAPGEKPPGKGKHAQIPTTPIEIAEALGLPLLLGFLGTSVIAVWFTIERLVVLRRGRVIPRPFVERFLQNLEQGNLEPEQALALCEENGSSIALIFAHGIRKWGKSSVEVEQAIIDGGERQVSHLRSHLRVLNAVAQITPLMGLLGTVIGMIQCFNEVAVSQAMGKADQLAGGIGIALLATAGGLVVAIPSLTMYMYLAGRVDSLVMDMDLLAQNIVHLVSAEALADGAQLVGKGRSRRGSTPTPEPKERKAV